MIKTIILFTLLIGLSACDASDEFKVVKLNKAVFTGSQNDPLSQACQNWKLDFKDVKAAFILSKPIDSSVLHYQFYQLPCEITGEAVLKGKPIGFTLNAGSYFIIEGNNKNSYYSGCSTNQCKRFFLMSPESTGVSK